MGWAQTGTGVSGPVTGFVFSGPAGAIQPMLGIPGAAYLGGPVTGGLKIASVSPDGNSAVGIPPGVRQGDRLVAYSGLRGSTLPVAANVAGSIAGADQFAWSPDGTSVAVYASSSGLAQTIAGLAKSPAGSVPIDLSRLPGPVTVLAFDGKRLIAGVSGAAGGIYLASAGQGPQRIAQSGSPAAIALAGDNLYFADNQSQQIWEVKSYAATPAAAIFASDSGISSPAGLQVSADGRRLLAANAGNQKLEVYDIASRSVVQSLDLTFVPARLERFGDASVFLMNGSGSGPLYVVRDGGPGNATVYFVPAPATRRPLKAPIRRM